MKNHVFSLLTGLLITLGVSLFSAHYLSSLKNKRGFETSHGYLETVETMDQRFNDLKYKYAKNRKPPSNVVLLAIDDASLREIGRWPWDRDIISQLLDKLISYDVKAVGLDVNFPEPERNFPEHDAQLGAVIEKHPEKIVLGAFSEAQMKLQPYQDYCVTEAFLASGGEKMMKINPSFVVDDMGEVYDDLSWGALFTPIFANIKRETESEYLAQMNKRSIEGLTQFQKNYLEAKKIQDSFEYCGRWLTDKDSFLVHHKDQLLPVYAELFKKKTHLAKMNVEQQIEAFKKEVSDLPVPQYGEWQANIPTIQSPALYTASFVAHLDLDGYVRRYPLFYRSGNRLGTSFIPSLALQSYLAATGYRADVTVEKIKNKKMITSFVVKDPTTEPEKIVQELPVDAEGRLNINFYGPRYTTPSVSAKDLFSDEDTVSVVTLAETQSYGQVTLNSKEFSKKEFFKDKTVIIGATAMAVYDLRNTPISANYPGPEIHTTVLGNLFAQEYVSHIKNEQVILPIALFVIGLLMTFALSFMGAGQSVLAMLICIGSVVWIDAFIFMHYHKFFSSVFLVIEIPLIFFAVLVVKYSSEEKKKNELRKMFSKYVSPAVVDELLKSNENLKLGGRKQEMSVFFSDVRGFTEFSERMDPQDLSNFLNQYLTPMTEIVFNNKGTLDKYMGDGLMAFFGAPVAYSNHAYYACKCALESLERLKLIQADCEKNGWPHIDIGIGINSGSMSVGNMGSKIVQSYTVIGDAVNLGSRLESANKEYGTRILISEMTYQEIKDQFVTREVDLVRVKGKKEPIKAYELISEAGVEDKIDWLKAYDIAYTSYQKQHFEVAKKQFEHIIADHPHDKVSKMYLKRCNEFIESPPASNWDGVFEMKAK